MRAGTMDIRIKVLRPSKIEAPSGQVAKVTWIEDGTYWAERPKDAAHLVNEAGELFEQITAEFRVRWGVEVAHGWRVVDPDCITYNIDTVQRYRRIGMIKLTCTRINE